jgi:N6-L-threonylcarbamoyladenine synthase
MDQYTVLGIETSCDETAASVVRWHDGYGEILSNCVFSQIDTHAPYGGVVPELAARQHLPLISDMIAHALMQADLPAQSLDAIAATAGPGLIGGVMIGLTTGKALASALGKPIIPVNHLEAHALTARLSAQIKFPYLLLLVSGGHCQLLVVEALGQYRLLGQTLDDAVGEAFDKTAKYLGLSYPGGPEIEARAALGDAARFPLPRPLAGQPHANFSFSGLKTAMQQAADKAAPLTEADINDLCASMQSAILDCLLDRTAVAATIFTADYGKRAESLVIAGGVAANRYLRNAMQALSEEHNLALHVAPSALCTDNAAMIAWTGCEYLAAKRLPDQKLAQAMAAQPRWPLAELKAIQNK